MDIERSKSHLTIIITIEARTKKHVKKDGRSIDQETVESSLSVASNGTGSRWLRQNI